MTGNAPKSLHLRQLPSFPAPTCRHAVEKDAPRATIHAPTNVPAAGSQTNRSERPRSLWLTANPEPRGGGVLTFWTGVDAGFHTSALSARALRRDAPRGPRDGPKVAGFHALRHTTGSLLLDAGVHLKVVQTLTRHSTITLTMDLYGHACIDSVTDAVSRLPDFSAAAREQKRARGKVGAG